MHRRLQLQALSYDRHEHVRAHGDPGLALHSVLGGAEERLDPQVMFDPFEVQRHLRAHLLELADSQWLEVQMVGDERQLLARLGIFETDATRWLRVALFGIEDGERDRVVADHAGAAVGCAPGESFEGHASFGTGQEERACLIESRQALEIDMAAIHDIEGASLWNKLIENVDVMKLAVADMQESRDISVQIEQSVELHSRLGRAERCPRKQRQAQIDSCRVESVDGVVELNSKRLAGIEVAGRADQTFGEIGIDAPVARRVCIGEGVAGHPTTDAHVIDLLRLSAQARLDVAQALPEGQLRKHHDQELIHARENLELVLPAVARQAATEGLLRQMLDQLGEHRLAGEHGGPWLRRKPKIRQMPESSSSR